MAGFRLSPLLGTVTLQPPLSLPWAPNQTEALPGVTLLVPDQKSHLLTPGSPDSLNTAASKNYKDGEACKIRPF